MHYKEVSGGPSNPSVDHCLVVAVKEELLSIPLLSPGKACDGDGVELFPLN